MRRYDAIDQLSAGDAEALRRLIAEMYCES